MKVLDIIAGASAIIAFTIIIWTGYRERKFNRPPYVRLTMPGKEPIIVKVDEAFKFAEPGCKIEGFPGVYKIVGNKVEMNEPPRQPVSKPSPTQP